MVVTDVETNLVRVRFIRERPLINLPEFEEILRKAGAPYFVGNFLLPTHAITFDDFVKNSLSSASLSIFFSWLTIHCPHGSHQSQKMIGQLLQLRSTSVTTPNVTSYTTSNNYERRCPFLPSDDTLKSHSACRLTPWRRSDGKSCKNQPEG
jgi:hypothetical protein